MSPVLPKGSASGAHTLASMPKCKRCGTAVEDASVKFCNVCGPLVQAQRPSQSPTIIIVREGKAPEPEK